MLSYASLPKYKNFKIYRSFQIFRNRNNIAFRIVVSAYIIVICLFQISVNTYFSVPEILWDVF